MSRRQASPVSMESLGPLIREQLACGQSVRFSPRGVSMLPMLREGKDSVILSPVPEHLKKYDVAFYQREDGSYVLHRVVKAGETYTCLGDNQIYPEPGLRPEQMIAVLSAFYRGDRRISVTAPGYRLYCRFWLAVLPFRKLRRRVKGKLRRVLRHIK